MQAMAIRRYLQPSPTLRWHPWAPLVAGILLVTVIFALGAMWGFSAATRMAADERAYVGPSFARMGAQLEAARPARAVVDSARSFDAAVIRWARQTEAERSLSYRLRVSLEDALFGLLRENRNPRRRIDLHDAYRDAVTRNAEYRLTNLSGTASAWQRTATLCEEVGRGYDSSGQLETAAAAYTAVLGQKITAQQLAPLSGARCD